MFVEKAVYIYRFPFNQIKLFKGCPQPKLNSLIKINFFALRPADRKCLNS